MPNVWMSELLTPAASHICDRKHGKVDEKVFLVLQPLLQNRDRKGVSVGGTVWGTFIDASSSSEKTEQQLLKSPKLSVILSISELASYGCCCSGRRTAPHNHHDKWVKVTLFRCIIHILRENTHAQSAAWFFFPVSFNKRNSIRYAKVLLLANFFPALNSWTSRIKCSPSAVSHSQVRD